MNVVPPLLALLTTDPPPPLEPRYETPAEIAEREAQEPFQTPSEIAAAREEPPAAWTNSSHEVSVSAGQRHGLLDVRAFYQGLSGESRPNWKGIELLTYAGLHDGIYAAGLFRNEVRDVAGRYFSGMLVGRLRHDVHLITGVGFGNGADFFPLARLDGSLRVRTPWRPWLMVDVGGMSAWFTQDRHQSNESAALLFWLGENIIEARQYVFVTSVPGERKRVNPAYALVWLHGAEGVRWLVARLMLASDTANVPGVPYAGAPSRYGIEGMVSYRHWLTPDYGLVATMQWYRQFDIYSRIGGDFAYFVHY